MFRFSIRDWLWLTVVVGLILVTSRERIQHESLIRDHSRLLWQYDRACDFLTKGGIKLKFNDDGTFVVSGTIDGRRLPPITFNPPNGG